jgi:hypothetical protein
VSTQWDEQREEGGLDEEEGAGDLGSEIGGGELDEAEGGVRSGIDELGGLTEDEEDG